MHSVAMENDAKEFSREKVSEVHLIKILLEGVWLWQINF